MDETKDQQPDDFPVKSLASDQLDAQLAEAVEQINDLLVATPWISDDLIIAEYPDHAQPLTRLLPAMRAVAQLSQSSSTESSRRDDSADGSSLVPRMIGDFRIVREIGRGGMGVVYEAEQISLGRRVALKVLRMAGLLDENQLVRFRNEAKAAATLHHPNIVPVFAVGSERGIHYYAMQYIDGPSLAQVIQTLRDDEAANRRLNDSVPDVAEPVRGDATTLGELQAELATVRTDDRTGYHRHAAKCIAQAAEAMAYAHDSGILHRDIKPGNLLLDDSGGLWIADFGLARIEADVTMTMTGDLLGTLRYMSPEQALGRRVLVDQRTDIYALGMTLYEFLTLQPAFGGSSREELLRQVAFEEPNPPREIDHTIPVDLETIVLKAISKEPDERYFSADDFARDLKRFLSGQTIEARRAPLARKITKFAVRHRTAVAICATTVLLALVSIILVQSISAGKVRHALSDLEQKNRQLEVAIASSEQARTAAERSYRVAHDAVSALYPEFRRDVVENNLTPENEDIWVYKKNVNLNRQLLALRPDDRELRFQAAEVLWAYAAFVMNRVNDPTDVPALLNEATELVGSVSPDTMSLEELAISVNVIILKFHHQNPDQLDDQQFAQAGALVDLYIRQLEENRRSSDVVNWNHYLILNQIQHNLLMVLPEGDLRRKIALRAIETGRAVHAEIPNNGISTFMFATVLKDAARYDKSFLTEAAGILEQSRKLPAGKRFDVVYASVLLRLADQMDDDGEKEKTLRRVIKLTEPTVINQPAKRDAWLSYSGACTDLGNMQLLRLEFSQAIKTLDQLTSGLRRILDVQPDNEQCFRELSDNLLTQAVAYAGQQDQERFQQVVDEAVAVEFRQSKQPGEQVPDDVTQIHEKCIRSIVEKIEEFINEVPSKRERDRFRDAIRWIAAET